MDDRGDLRDLRLIAIFNDRGKWAIRNSRLHFLALRQFSPLAGYCFPLTSM